MLLIILATFYFIYALNFILFRCLVLPILFIYFIHKSLNKYGFELTKHLIICGVCGLISFILMMFSPGVENEGSMKGFSETMSLFFFSSIFCAIEITFFIIYLVKKKKMDTYLLEQEKIRKSIVENIVQNNQNNSNNTNN